MIRREHALACFFVLMGFLAVSTLSYAQEPKEPMVYEGTVGGLRYLEEGQPPAVIHATVEDMKRSVRPTPMRGLVPCNQPAPQMTFTTMAELAAPESKRPRKS